MLCLIKAVWDVISKWYVPLSYITLRYVFPADNVETALDVELNKTHQWVNDYSYTLKLPMSNCFPSQHLFCRILPKRRYLQFVLPLHLNIPHDTTPTPHPVAMCSDALILFRSQVRQLIMALIKGHLAVLSYSYMCLEHHLCVTLGLCTKRIRGFYDFCGWCDGSLMCAAIWHRYLFLNITCRKVQWDGSNRSKKMTETHI